MNWHILKVIWDMMLLLMSDGMHNLVTILNCRRQTPTPTVATRRRHCRTSAAFECPAAVECCQTLSPRYTLLLTIAVVYYHRQTLPLIAPPSIVPPFPSFIIAGKRQRPLRNLPQSNADTCNYNTRVCDASGNCSALISLSSDADDVAQGRRVTSAVVIGHHRPTSEPPPHCLPAPPPAYVDC